MSSCITQGPISFPGFSPTRSVGRVGENRGNEVAQDPYIVRKGTLSVTKSLRFANIKEDLAVVKKN